MVGSLIEYDGFLRSGAAALSAAVKHDTPRLSLGGQGSWTIFESGNPIIQATAAAAWLSQPRERWGLELGGSAGAFQYADEPASGHLLGRARVHYFANRSGGWVAATTGASFDSWAEAPLELGIGGWTVHGPFAFTAAVTRTWLAGERYTDFAGAAKWLRGAVEVEMRAGARPTVVSDAENSEATTGVWADISALVPLAPSIALTLSGGSYASDPVRRVLGASYVTAGLRLALSRSERTPVLTIPPAMIAAVRDHSRKASTLAARLEITARGDLHSIRVHIPEATSVDLMADFTDWQPLALKRVGKEIWELQVALTPGVHRLNVRVNGGEWLVPNGARPEEGEFGGSVGVIVVR
jgi:hypothetical protein